MPSYRGIHVSLQSQYDALVLPEYSPPPAVATVSSAEDGEQIAKVATDSKHVPEAYVPMYAGSQFWILYNCPRPDVMSPPEDTTRFYYFKLVINSKVVLSWGCGAENNFSGRTNFGLYGREVEGYGTVVEKRGFFFPAGKDVDRKGMIADSFEVRVYRAKGRRRVEPSYEQCTTTDSKSVNFRPSGPVKRYDPKRFYTYALIDPVDTPHATFSFKFRTGGQLKAVRNGSLGTPEKRTDKDSSIDILTASPSKRSIDSISPLSHNMLSPPPKEKPAPPPKDFAAKDSIALRRLSLLHQGSPVKKSPSRKPAATFDAMEGLSLARGAYHSQRTPATSPKKLQKKELSRRTPSLFTFGLSKKRQGSREREEQSSAAPMYHAK